MIVVMASVVRKIISTAKAPAPLGAYRYGSGGTGLLGSLLFRPDGGAVRCPLCVVTERFCVAVCLRSVVGFCGSTEQWSPECFLGALKNGLRLRFPSYKRRLLTF